MDHATAAYDAYEAQDTEPAPLERIGHMIAAEGVAGRRLRAVIAALTEQPWTLAALIQHTSVERRAIEGLITALGEDLLQRDGRLQIRKDAAPDYRALVDPDALRRTAPADPLGAHLAQSTGLVTRMRTLIEQAPAPRQALDHVPATPATAAKRALWLDGTFQLPGARLLCIGDHDLTSLAAALVNPGLEITVVDVDKQLLTYIDAVARRESLNIRCLYSDFRYGLARGAQQWGDLVFTDPPYTPEGVELFLTRGLEGLRDREHARLMMAYGYGAHHPGLGLKVQQSLSALHLVYEAIWPQFNRYNGAQAVGSSSDLYVLRPSTRSWRVVDQPTKDAAAHIYTHGAQSLEGAADGLAAETHRALLAAAQPGGLPLAALVGARGPQPPGAARIALGTVLGAGLPQQLRRKPGGVAVDLAEDPGSWLARTLIALDAEHVALLVPNNHPDLADQAGQTALKELIGPKYRLTLRRSTPEPRYALVEAARIDPARLATPDRIRRYLLDRPHGKIANTWREALIAAAGQQGRVLSKNEARALVQVDEETLGVQSEQLLDLPRHQIAYVLQAAASSAGL